MIRQHRSSAIDESTCSGGACSGAARVGLDLLVQGLDPRQTVAEGRLPAEAVHRDVGQRSPQPATALLLGQVPQNMPGLGRGLEGGLDQILGHRPVPAGQHARIPEQVTGMALKQAASSSASRGEILPSLTAHLLAGKGSRRQPVSPGEREESRR